MSELAMIEEKIVHAAERSGRDGLAVTLLAVTKTVPLERVQPLLDAGLRDVGENRVQEAIAKYSDVTPKPILHLIGPLQSNKVKKAVEFFDVIQSLDSLELAKEISQYAQSVGKRQTCLIQIKISAEATKSGLDPEKLTEFLSQLKDLPALELRGLMGIPPLNAAGNAARPYFQRLKKLFDAHTKVAKDFDTLSMGMSSDFEVAIEEGSTLVRIGTALFGLR